MGFEEYSAKFVSFDILVMFGPNSAPVASELLPDSSADCAILLLTQFDCYFILDLDCSLVLLINLL